MSFDPSSLSGKMFPDCYLQTADETCMPSSLSWTESGITVPGQAWMLDGLVWHSADDAYSECSLAEILVPDAAPGRTARQGIAANVEDDAGISRIAGSLGANTTGGHRADLDSVGAYIPTTSPTVSAKWSKGTGGPSGDEVQNVVAFAQNTRDEVRLFGGDGGHVGALAAQPGAKQQTYVAATLTASYAHGRGQHGGKNSGVSDGHLLASALTNDPTAGHNGNVNNLLASALTASMGHHGHSSPRGDGSDNLIAWESRYARNGRGAPDDIVPPLKAQSGQTGKGDAAPLVGVRRLTPIECERLQGFPDDWTRWGADGEEMSDSARYRMCGNAVNRKVSAWIGKSMMKVMS
jgi:DNA (cytosine-5)-methyltransferase 1